MLRRAGQKVRARQETHSPSKERPQWQPRAGAVLEKQTKGPHAGSGPQDALGPGHQRTGETACCSDSGRPHDQMFLLCLCWPGPAGPQRVWPRAPQVRRMRSSCRAACRGTGSRPSSLAKAVPGQVAGREAVPTHTELDGGSEDENQTRCPPSGSSTCPGKRLLAGPWSGRRKPPGRELPPRRGSAGTPTQMRS